MKKTGIIFMLFALLSVLSLQAQTAPLVGSWYVDEEVSEGGQNSGIIRTQFTFEQNMNMDMVIVVLMSLDAGDGVTIDASLGGDVEGKWELNGKQMKMHLDPAGFEMSDTEVKIEGLTGVNPTNISMMQQAVAEQFRSEFSTRFAEAVGGYASGTFTVVSVDENQLMLMDEKNETTTFHRFVSE